MISHIEYLVKPFLDSKDLPIDGCKSLEIGSVIHNSFLNILEEISQRGITAEAYLDIMLGLWKERVNYVQLHPNSQFIMIDIFHVYEKYSTKTPKQLLSLRECASTKLGNRFVSFNSGYETANYLIKNGDLENQLNIHAYGEISNRCAIGETNELVRNLNHLKPELDINVDFDKNLCPDLVEGKF